MKDGKSNMDFVKPNNGALSHSENNGFVYPNINPNYLTKKNLWDSGWLKDKYPSRFEGEGSWDIRELNEDRFDPLLFPEKFDK